MRAAALLLLCGAAAGLAGCGGGSAASAGELRLQREDLLAACRALRQTEAAVVAELSASKRAWRLVANGLPREDDGVPGRARGRLPGLECRYLCRGR